MRKNPLVTGEVYHVFSKSIAGFVIFNQDDDFLRIKHLLKYYQIKNELKFSAFIELRGVINEGFDNFFSIISKDKEKLVQVIAYCFMPTHVHLIVKQLVKNGISIYLSNVLNSYTRYFNTKHKRKGPLWESEFKNVLVDDNEQLLHLTRYIHLNPVTASIVNTPEDWPYSSYKEYIFKQGDYEKISQFEDFFEIKPLLYRKFVNDQISYQKELAKIKKLIIN